MLITFYNCDFLIIIMLHPIILIFFVTPMQSLRGLFLGYFQTTYAFQVLILLAF